MWGREASSAPPGVTRKDECPTWNVCAFTLRTMSESSCFPIVVIFGLSAKMPSELLRKAFMLSAGRTTDGVRKHRLGGLVGNAHPASPGLRGEVPASITAQAPWLERDRQDPPKGQSKAEHPHPPRRAWGSPKTCLSPKAKSGEGSPPPFCFPLSGEGSAFNGEPGSPFTGGGGGGRGPAFNVVIVLPYCYHLLLILL